MLARGKHGTVSAALVARTLHWRYLPLLWRARLKQCFFVLVIQEQIKTNVDATSALHGSCDVSRLASDGPRRRPLAKKPFPL